MIFHRTEWQSGHQLEGLEVNFTTTNYIYYVTTLVQLVKLRLSWGVSWSLNSCENKSIQTWDPNLNPNSGRIGKLGNWVGGELGYELKVELGMFERPYWLLTICAQVRSICEMGSKIIYFCHQSSFAWPPHESEKGQAQAKTGAKGRAGGSGTGAGAVATWRRDER